MILEVLTVCITVLALGCLLFAGYLKHLGRYQDDRHSLLEDRLGALDDKYEVLRNKVELLRTRK